MEIKKYQTTSGRTYEIAAETWETRSAWGHRAMLGNYSKKVRYYNRTWESWQYQTVIRCLLDEIIDGIKEAHISNYKYTNNIKRLTAAKKQAALEQLKEIDTYYRDLLEVRQQVGA